MRWYLKEKDEQDQIEKLANDLSVENTIAKILFNRNITTYNEAKRFFRPSLEDSI